MELFPKNENGQYLANTGDLQQSRFLPLLQRAERDIKKLITKYFLTMGSLYQLRITLNTYIADFDRNKLPLDIENRDSYVNGLYTMANKVFGELEKKRKEFVIVAALVVNGFVKKGYQMPTIKNPVELTKFIEKNKAKITYDMFSQAKASVRVQNYANALKEYISKVSEIPTNAVEKGKKPISIWQKAELDIRHSKQMEMVENARNSRDDLYWISSHPDCSKRCQKWQGKLVSVTKHANMSGFRVGKEDNHWVYSLTDIMAQKDEYGYNNNIISGFNCRHYLIKYEKGKLPPKEYSGEDIKRMREINNKIREMERAIRQMKTERDMYKQVNDTRKVKILDAKIKAAIAHLREFCNKNGFAFQEYRV